MALPTSTIGQLTLSDSISNLDLIEIERAADNLSRHVTRLQLIGATLTGEGNILTNGKTLTINDTGIAALLNVAQSFSSLKTFGAGISFGNETLSAYRSAVVFPVTLTSSNGDAVIAQHTTAGRYYRIGSLCFYRFGMIVPTITTPGTGDLRVPLPIAAASGSGSFVGSALFHQVDVPGTPFNAAFRVDGGNSYATFWVSSDNAGVATVPVTGIVAGDQIYGTVFYEV